MATGDKLNQPVLVQGFGLNCTETGAVGQIIPVPLDTQIVFAALRARGCMHSSLRTVLSWDRSRKEETDGRQKKIMQEENCKWNYTTWEWNVICTPLFKFSVTVKASRWGYQKSKTEVLIKTDRTVAAALFTFGSFPCICVCAANGNHFCQRANTDTYRNRMEDRRGN